MALEARELVKSYGRRCVVNHLSFHIERGKITGLLGPNGAGKTTSFYMMIGFIMADEGRVLLDGGDISQLPFSDRARLGISYLPQEPSVFTRATVAENLDLALEWRIDPDKHRETRERLLEEFHLTSLKTRRAGTLSSGERRRLEIARALACDPSYILLDEPFSGIDPLSVNDLQKRMSALKARGIGLMLTDHNVRDTLTITDTAYLIHEGCLIASGTPQEIVQAPLARRLYFGEDFKH
jgi:lipopolysaccharide export system ATP-binding protein